MTWRVLLAAYHSKLVVSATLLSFGAYTLLFYFLDTYSNLGVFLLTIPLYLAFLLIFSSSVLFALSIEYLNLAARSKKPAAGLSTSLGSILVGVTTATCTCSAPLLAGLLYFLGAKTLEVSAALVFFSAHQVEILIVIVLLNSALSVYYLRLSARYFGVAGGR